MERQLINRRRIKKHLDSFEVLVFGLAEIIDRKSYHGLVTYLGVGRKFHSGEPFGSGM